MSTEKSGCPPSSSKPGPVAIQQNNRLYHREAVARDLAQATQNRKRNRGTDKNKSKNEDGFVYAIQADGNLIAEQKWQEKHGKVEPYQTPPPQPTNSSQMIWSLQKLQAELGASRTRYQQRQKLPPVPVSKPKMVVPLYQPKPDKAVPSQIGPSSAPPPPTKSIPSCPELAYSQNSYSKSSSSAGAINPYNRASGQFPNRGVPPDRVPSTTPAQKPSNPWPQQRPPENEFDDDLDDLLANIDEDVLVSQTTARPTQKAPAPRRVTNDKIIIDVDDPSNNTGFDYGDSSPYVQSNNSYNNSSSAPMCPGHNIPCQIMSATNGASRGRKYYKCSMPSMDEQCKFFQWKDDYESSYDNNNSGSSYNNTNFQNQSSSYSGNHQNNNSSFGGGSGFDAMDYGDSTSGAPLCAGHNLPCQILTSRSEKNPDRQFYKCPLQQQDEQCDFFEWADGNDGNTNSSSSNWVQTTLPGVPAPRPLTSSSKDIHAQNLRFFGHQKFRKGQQEIIEQALSGRDVFVLMPTGGGKSLCYQLPAVICPGLSVVISPLLSLVQDQVQNLKKAGVKSVFLNSSQDYETEQKDITRQLNATTADSGVKLLYLTPEKLRHSNMIQQILVRLYQNNLLSRFVIDEAHCLSDWGHDFRPDYSALNLLRESYPNVPLMALTATANQKVVDDAIGALRMRNTYLYKTSFNRPNLHYEVHKKDSKSEESICDYIVSQYQNNNQSSGVIYCLSRKDCEKLSERLQEKLNKRGMYSIRVSFYHAELDAHERQRRHLQWSNGTLSVLCATIAFGMGIDKPDVRFVMHYSMPKSITHYYQESGRAGRDGEKADCILYYSYKDKQVLEGMIRKSSTNPYGQSTRRKIDQLYSCLRYCEDDFRCRRTLQLEHFGEEFNRAKCRGTCDNCRQGREIEKRDMTEVAQCLLKLLASVQSQKKNGMGVTLLQLTELFRGSKSKATTKFLNVSRLQGYNDTARFKLKKKQDIDRVAHAMVFEKIIVEQSEQNKQGFASDYVQQGEMAAATRDGRRQFFVEFANPKSKGKENTASKATSNKKRKKSPAPKKKATGRKSASGKGNSGVAAEDDNTLIFKDVGDKDVDSDGDDDEDESADASDSATPSAVLPAAIALKLQKRIKKVLLMWATEEQMMGGSTYYWHIMTNKMLKTVSAQCPTTLDELKALGGLGESRFKEYGPRLIKNIQNFVQTENLEQFLEEKKASRPTKTRKVVDDDFDEFPLDFDESALAGLD